MKTYLLKGETSYSLHLSTIISGVLRRSSKNILPYISITPWITKPSSPFRAQSNFQENDKSSSAVCQYRESKSIPEQKEIPGKKRKQEDSSDWERTAFILRDSPHWTQTGTVIFKYETLTENTRVEHSEATILTTFPEHW